MLCVQPSFLTYLFLRRLCSWGLHGGQPSVERRKGAVRWVPMGLAAVLSDALHRRPGPGVQDRGMCVTHSHELRSL